MLFYKLNTIWIQFICKLLNKIEKTAPPIKFTLYVYICTPSLS